MLFKDGRMYQSIQNTTRNTMHEMCSIDYFSSQSFVSKKKKQSHYFHHIPDEEVAVVVDPNTTLLTSM
jgi:hypothetical protein